MIKPERIVGIVLVFIATVGMINDSMHYLAITALAAAGVDLVIWGGEYEEGAERRRHSR